MQERHHYPTKKRPAEHIRCLERHQNRENSKFDSFKVVIVCHFEKCLLPETRWSFAFTITICLSTVRSVFAMIGPSGFVEITNVTLQRHSYFIQRISREKSTVETPNKGIIPLFDLNSPNWQIRKFSIFPNSILS